MNLMLCASIVSLAAASAHAQTTSPAQPLRPGTAVGAATREALPPPLTPKPPPEPRINGPKVFGVRPGHPLVFTIPASGERPMTFSARGLPQGIDLDAATGRLAGVLKTAGEHNVTLVAQNARGKAERAFRIVVGEKIALTPPMGWNSWNCWGGNIDANKIRAAARGMAESGLINHGWCYVNIDDAWQGLRAPPDGALQGNERFPDMQKLCDEVHALGLKIGLYSTPWRISFAGYAGEEADSPDGKYFRPLSRPARRPEIHDRPTSGPATAPARTRFDRVDAKQWARWGIDYLKYDWRPIDPHNTKVMADALRACGRDIVYSLSNAADFDQAGTWAQLANCWRTTRDIRDSWASMSGIGFSQDRWKEFAGPGHWNDPDMLFVGRRGNGRPSSMTADEQYTHISLWCLLAAPLLLGCDLQKLDDFTLGLLTNDEVIEVNQDPLGKQAGLIHKDGDVQVWAKDMEDGSKAMGLFNLGPSAMQAAAPWKALGVGRPQRVRDLWRQHDLSRIGDQLQVEIPSHGAMLLRAWMK